METKTACEVIESFIDCNNNPADSDFDSLIIEAKKYLALHSSNVPQNADSITRSYHVGESDYSTKPIQPWDTYINWGLNPWDADILKRIVRTKIVPGLTAKNSRIQDYEKIKHICDERIDQINNGDPYYQNFVIPPWVEKYEKDS